jgi:uncharacterized protein
MHTLSIIVQALNEAGAIEATLVVAAPALLPRHAGRRTGARMAMKHTCPVIVMAKAPLAGFAKTRLIPALGAEGAAAPAECLLERAVVHALDARPGIVDLCCTPDAAHPALKRHAAWPGMALSLQGDGDLGARMTRAFERRLADTRSVLMIGTDAPALDGTMLQRAAHAVQRADAVFVPAHDGGYALIGLRRMLPALFSDMPWSSDSVIAETRHRLAAAGWRHIELPAVHDIDVPADLAHLPRNLRAALGAGRPVRCAPQPRTLALPSTADGHALASGGRWSVSGRWAWRWKDHVDRTCVRRFAVAAIGEPHDAHQTLNRMSR